MEKYPLIRKIYLYLFSMVGLVLVIIGAARFVDMGLKTYVFTQAYEQEKMDYARPGYFNKEFVDVVEVQSGKEQISLSKEKTEQLRYVVAEFERWEERQKDFDPIRARKHRDAAGNLAMMLVGLPLYLYHWFVIRKELKA